MPLYDWKCEKCNQEVAVIRATAEYENTPTPEEVPGDGGLCVHVWKRFLKAAPAASKSWLWDAKGGKGRW